MDKKNLCNMAKGRYKVVSGDDEVLSRHHFLCCAAKQARGDVGLTVEKWHKGTPGWQKRGWVPMTLDWD